MLQRQNKCDYKRDNYRINNQRLILISLCEKTTPKFQNNIISEVHGSGC